MDGKEPDKYVADLLKQLEELKRKKAHKEKKLMKLKSGVPKDHKNHKSGTSKKLSCSKALKSSLVSESESNENQIFAENKIAPIDDSSSRSYHFINNSDNIVAKNFKENFLKPNFELFEYHKLRNNVQRFSDVESFVNKPDTSHSREIVKDHSSLILNNEKFDECEIKSDPNDGYNKENVEIFSSVSQHTGENINQEKYLNANIGFTSEIKENQFNPDNLICDISDVCHSTNKDCLLSKNKEMGSDLNDPLDSNMSCFLSSESSDMLIDDGYNIKDGNVYVPLNQAKCSEPTDAEMKTEIPKYKISPTFSLSFSNESQQISSDILNFPKFSTPTDIQSGIDKTVLSNLDIKSEALKTVCDESDHVDNDGCTFESENSIGNVSSPCKNFLQENRFKSVQLNSILGNELSSILDAHYASPVKPLIECSTNVNLNLDQNSNAQKITVENVSKKRKLFPFSNSASNLKQEAMFEVIESINDDSNCKKFALDQDLKESSNSQLQNNLQNHLIEVQCIDEDIDFGNTTFDSFSDSFNDSRTMCPESVLLCATSNSNKIQSQVTKTVNELINEVCKNSFNFDSSCTVKDNVKINTLNVHGNENRGYDAEVLIVPETEGLGQYFSNDTEDFLETSALSEGLQHFEVKENLLNTSSKLRSTSSVVNNIVSTIKCTKNQSDCVNDDMCLQKDNLKNNKLTKTQAEIKRTENSECVKYVPNSLDLDSPFIEDDTKNLGNFKKVPYMNEENDQGNSGDKCNSKSESNLNVKCFLYGSTNEPVVDIEIIIFNNEKYAFIQHETQIHVWRQIKNNDWIRIFQHQIESVLSLVKIGTSVDEENLVLVMLLSNDQKCCLQFLLFEKGAKVIKLMENTHWLEERFSKEFVLLCGLDGLMFATAQCRKNHEISLHAFISLRENPRLMTASLGSTDGRLSSLCKIDKLPNALLGINDTMLYVWHILEARLVTAVSLHPHDYLPVKSCFWATVEKGLIYFLTTCDGENDFEVCQLLAANLATGFCQCAMTYSTQPSKCRKQIKITKAAYLEPFLVVSHSGGAVLWSVTEEYCCAALSTKSEVTTLAISKDTEDWGLLAVGSNFGCVTCYSIH